MNKVLVIAPHPDDETLGCGGTLLKHKSFGDDVHWLIMTNIFEKDGWQKEVVNRRQSEIDMVAEMYSFISVHKLNFATTKLDNEIISDLVKEISNVINKFKPNIIYLNNNSDVHTDHQITFKSVMSSVKSFRQPFIGRILMYETVSETEFSAPLPGNAFQPNVFVDITKFFEQKCKIMKLYESELMNSPYPRSMDVIEALAKYRGSRIGVKYAEAFSLLYEKL